MIILSSADQSLLLKFQSDITFVDVAVEIIRNVLHYLAVEDPTNLLLVSKELLKNAVVHGNQNDRDKEVVYRLSRSGLDQFRVEVEDAGTGFGRKKDGCGERKKQQVRGGAEPGGLGFEIVHSLCQQVILDEKEGRITVLLAP